MNSAKPETGIVLALVGESGAGKTTTTGILAKRGFAPIALARHLRETAIAKYGTPEREEVQALARETQKTEGDDYYARMALSDAAFTTNTDVVIDGLRNKAELDLTVARVKASGRGFLLVAVIASDDTRFSRVVNRGRAGDPLERARFDRDDARARGSLEDGFQQNALLIELADHRIMNTGDLAALHRSIDETVALARTTAKGTLDHD